MEDEYTEAEIGAAKELEMPVEELRYVLDTYMAHCKDVASKRREASRKRLERYGIAPLD